jgi:hypothetical protein
MSLRTTLMFLVAIEAFSQAPQPAPPAPTRGAPLPTPKGREPAIRYVESGSGVVAVNPTQPYRPIPVGVAAPRDSIFGFYLRVLNPRQIKWGTEIDRRLANLREQSVGNPYFRLASFQLGLIVILLMLCWVWWDKMRQIKWVAAECLTDALNAKTLAESRAVDAIGRHNRHIELCNRVIEGQSSGIGGTIDAGNSALTVRELQTELAASRANCARLQYELDQSKVEYAQVDGRLATLEAEVRHKAAHPDPDLVARLERAESELAGRKDRRTKP